jgi:formiminoglutamase
MTNTNYATIDKSFWTGRIDDLSDRDSFRIHQVIQCIDLNAIDNLQVNSLNTNICLLGFKSDVGVRRNLGRAGAELGPEYIRKELANLPVNFDDSTVIFDAGDIICEGEKLEGAQNELSKAICLILEKGLFPIVIGGGHALAFGHYNGIRKFLQNSSDKTESLGIINFDAHWDLRPYKKEGSSGTMFSQIADKCQKDDNEFNYMCLGIQTSGNTRNLFKRAQELNAEHILAKDFNNTDHKVIKSKVNSFINKNEHVYVTLCSDVFSSAFAPGVSAMQPFGMNPELVLNYIKMIFESNKVVAFDIAEVSPRFDHDNQTAKLAAVIIYAIVNQLSDQV